MGTIGLCSEKSQNMVIPPTFYMANLTDEEKKEKITQFLIEQKGLIRTERRKMSYIGKLIQKERYSELISFTSTLLKIDRLDLVEKINQKIPELNFDKRWKNEKVQDPEVHYYPLKQSQKLKNNHDMFKIELIKLMKKLNIKVNESVEEKIKEFLEQRNQDIFKEIVPKKSLKDFLFQLSELCGGFLFDKDIEQQKLKKQILEMCNYDENNIEEEKEILFKLEKGKVEQIIQNHVKPMDEQKFKQKVTKIKKVTQTQQELKNGEEKYIIEIQFQLKAITFEIESSKYQFSSLQEKLEELKKSIQSYEIYYGNEQKFFQVTQKNFKPKWRKFIFLQKYPCDAEVENEKWVLNIFKRLSFQKQKPFLLAKFKYYFGDSFQILFKFEEEENALDLQSEFESNELSLLEMQKKKKRKILRIQILIEYQIHLKNAYVNNKYKMSSKYNVFNLKNKIVEDYGMKHKQIKMYLRKGNQEREELQDNEKICLETFKQKNNKSYYQLEINMEKPEKNYKCQLLEFYKDIRKCYKKILQKKVRIPGWGDQLIKQYALLSRSQLKQIFIQNYFDQKKVNNYVEYNSQAKEQNASDEIQNLIQPSIIFQKKKVNPREKSYFNIFDYFEKEINKCGLYLEKKTIEQYLHENIKTKIKFSFLKSKKVKTMLDRQLCKLQKALKEFGLWFDNLDREKETFFNNFSSYFLKKKLVSSVWQLKQKQSQLNKDQNINFSQFEQQKQEKVNEFLRTEKQNSFEELKNDQLNNSSINLNIIRESQFGEQKKEENPILPIQENIYQFEEKNSLFQSQKSILKIKQFKEFIKENSKIFLNKKLNQFINWGELQNLALKLSEKNNIVKDMYLALQEKTIKYLDELGIEIMNLHIYIKAILFTQEKVPLQLRYTEKQKEFKNQKEFREYMNRFNFSRDENVQHLIHIYSYPGAKEGFHCIGHYPYQTIIPKNQFKQKLSPLKIFLAQFPQDFDEKLKDQKLIQFVIEQLKRKKSIEALLDKVESFIFKEFEKKSDNENENIAQILVQKISKEIEKFNSGLNSIHHCFQEEFVGCIHFFGILTWWKVFEPEVSKKKRRENYKQFFEQKTFKLI